MRTKWVTLAVGFAVGFGVCAIAWHYQAKQASEEMHRLALLSYSDFRDMGFTNLNQPALRSWWAQELRKDLEHDLARAPSDSGYADSYWGTAYLVLKDQPATPGAANGPWEYRADMNNDAQDNTIRYLCFRIGRGMDCHPFSDPAGREYHALATYPLPALKRNWSVLSTAIKFATRADVSYNHDDGFLWFNRLYADRLLTLLLSESGARELAWANFRYYTRNPQDPECRDLLEAVINASRGRAVFDGNKPSQETNAAAKAILDRIETLDWTHDRNLQPEVVKTTQSLIQWELSKPQNPVPTTGTGASSRP